MPSHHRNGLRAVALAAAVLFIASGGSEGAAVASSPATETVRPAATVRPTPSPTRPASPSPSPKPSASPEEVAARAVDSLKIGVLALRFLGVRDESGSRSASADRRSVSCTCSRSSGSR